MLRLVIFFVCLGSVVGLLDRLDPQYIPQSPSNQAVLFNPSQSSTFFEKTDVAMTPQGTSSIEDLGSAGPSPADEHVKVSSEADPVLDSPWLIVSPYIEQEHQLNLSTLDVPNQLLARALMHLEAATSAYATESYDHALNWPTVFAELKSLSDVNNLSWKTTTFYVVEFRSKLKADIDRPKLFRLDKESHREATSSGGLLKYWFGSPNAERRNLATCLWRSKEDAIAGGKGPEHKKARGVIPQMYESINVTGLKLTVFDDVEDWKFEAWSD